MRIQLVKNDEIVMDVDPETMRYEDIDAMTKPFNDQEVDSYVLTFKEGTLLKDCHDLSELSSDKIELLRLTLK